MRTSILLLCGLLTACAGAIRPGPRVRVATATPAELEAVQKEQFVWYEFLPGDVIPVQFGFLGAVEGGSQGESALRAKARFYFVTAKNGPIELSFDGKTLASDKSNQSVVAVLPRSDGKGGQLVWMIYMGVDGDPEKELDQLLNSSKK